MAKAWYEWLAFVLVIVGGLNWGLAVFNFNLVTTLFGSWPVLVQVVYGLVGLASLYLIYYLYSE